MNPEEILSSLQFLTRGLSWVVYQTLSFPKISDNQHFSYFSMLNIWPFLQIIGTWQLFFFYKGLPTSLVLDSFVTPLKPWFLISKNIVYISHLLFVRWSLNDLAIFFLIFSTLLFVGSHVQYYFLYFGLM